MLSNENKMILKMSLHYFKLLSFYNYIIYRIYFEFKFITEC